MDSPLIVLTTDFGLADPYVGMMKGVILRTNPKAALLDLTHQVRPQNILQGAFILGASHRFFPAGAIHVAVVDPGVGTNRRPIVLETAAAKFVAPDNGLLSCVISEYLESPPAAPGSVDLPPDVTAYHLTEPGYWMHPLSRTFHGRDVFAPVAAHLSLGVPPSRMGRPVHRMVWLPIPGPESKDTALWGEVIYADHYGNLVTNIPGGALDFRDGTVIEIAEHTVHRLSLTFHDEAVPGDSPLIALTGSLGYLEIAVRDGDAASTLGVGAGEPVRINHSTLS